MRVRIRLESESITLTAQGHIFREPKRPGDSPVVQNMVTSRARAAVTKNELEPGRYGFHFKTVGGLGPFDVHVETADVPRSPLAPPKPYKASGRTARLVRFVVPERGE